MLILGLACELSEYADLIQSQNRGCTHLQHTYIAQKLQECHTHIELLLMLSFLQKYKCNEKFLITTAAF